MNAAASTARLATMDSRERLHRDNVPAARILRSGQTRSEAILWAKLRARRFHGLKFRRQHPIGRFVLDFYCEDLRLAIEVDGGIHDGDDARIADTSRQRAIEELGIWFIRLRAEATESEVQAALATIERECRLT